MTAKKNPKTQNTRDAAQEFMRNFVQVPQMTRPIPAPEAKRAAEENRKATDGNRPY